MKFENGYYDQMIFLIRSLLEQALKTNNSLKFAVMAGCMRISKESIFTGFNNLKVLSITDERYDEYFGFTDMDAQACERALQQIEEKKYDEELRENGVNKILKYGIACYMKRCKVKQAEKLS